MPVIKYSIHESGYVGAFGTATDKYVFMGNSLNATGVRAVSGALGSECVLITVGMSDLVGIFARANSNGIVLSNIAADSEVKRIKELAEGINVGCISSNLNAIGNNILANDKIAIVNPEYGNDDIREIRDILDVEVIRYSGESFKTVGASNVLTNKGLLINNRCSDEEKEELDRATGMDSIRTTANTGALSIGLSVLANSKGVVIGSETTGFEIARITDALDIGD
jgi:translation initiation factor 6